MIVNTVYLTGVRELEHSVSDWYVAVNPLRQPCAAGDMYPPTPPLKLTR